MIHRDIAPHNILMGRKGAGPGFRGALINLEMAVPIDRDLKQVCSDPRAVSVPSRLR